MDYMKIFKTVFFVVVCILVGIFGTLTYQKITGPKQTVTVSGQGEVDAEVDQATIGIQVKNTSTTYALALEANQKDVASLKDALMKLGIPESRITQSSFTPPYRYMMEEPAAEGSDFMGMKRPEIVPDNNLTVTTNLTVIIDSLKNIEKVYGAINANPNTKITNTDYSLKNQKEWETKAKEEALKDARSQVVSIAKINRLKVGKLVSISDDSAPQPLMEQGVMFKREDSTGSGVSGTVSQTKSVNYTEQTVKIYASYTATYELY